MRSAVQNSAVQSSPELIDNICPCIKCAISLLFQGSAAVVAASQWQGTARQGAFRYKGSSRQPSNLRPNARR